MVPHHRARARPPRETGFLFRSPRSFFNQSAVTLTLDFGVLSCQRKHFLSKVTGFLNLKKSRNSDIIKKSYVTDSNFVIIQLHCM